MIGYIVAHRRVQCVAVLNTVYVIQMLRVVQKVEKPLVVPQDSLRPFTANQH